MRLQNQAPDWDAAVNQAVAANQAAAANRAATANRIRIVDADGIEDLRIKLTDRWMALLIGLWISGLDCA